MESLGHALRARVLRKIRRASLHQQPDLRLGGLRAGIFLGSDAGDGAGRAGKRIRCGVPIRVVRAAAGNRAGLRGPAKKALRRGRRRYARPPRLEW